MEDSASEPVFQRAPEGLLKFFHEQGVSVADLAEPPIRTVRVTRRVPPGQAGRVMAELGGELGAAPAALRWLPNFWALPCSAPLANAAVARSGQVIGMEASSGVAVAALDVRRGDDVLEICCAPGAKLCMLADATGPTGSVTGVDVSPSRMAACRTLLRRCVIGCHALRDSQDKRAAGCDEGAEQCVAGAAAPTEAAAADADAEHSARPAASAAHARCRLLCGDGTMLALGPPEKDSYSSQAGLVCILDTAHPATYRSKRAPAFTRPGKRKRSPLTDSTDGALSQDLAAARRAQLDAAWAVLPPGCAYDRVLVDVECTHDASGKHVAKVLRGDAAAANAWADQLAHKTMELQPLQRQLALAGFRLLRPGGTMVYSTCSLSRAQNEDVVRWLLHVRPDAQLLPVLDDDGVLPCARVPSTDCGAAPVDCPPPAWVPPSVPLSSCAVPCEGSAALPGCIRFVPRTSCTGGLFVAKLTKAPAPPSAASVSDCDAEPTAVALL